MAIFFNRENRILPGKSLIIWPVKNPMRNENFLDLIMNFQQKN